MKKANNFQKKAILGLVAGTIILCNSTSAFAGSGNGWSSTNIVLNGTSYPCTAAVEASDNGTAYVSCVTNARVERTHNAVTMKYKSKNDGIITSIGRDKPSVTVIGKSQSYAVYPKSQYSSFVSYVSITGNVVVTVKNQNGKATSYSFNPKFTN